jgi:hypothetical protein
MREVLSRLDVVEHLLERSRTKRARRRRAGGDREQ